MKKQIQNLLVLKQRSARAAVVGLAAAAAPFMAHAADGDIDTSAIIAKLTAAGTACAAIGVAYLVVVVGVKSYKLIRSAM